MNKLFGIVLILTAVKGQNNHEDPDASLFQRTKVLASCACNLVEIPCHLTGTQQCEHCYLAVDRVKAVVPTPSSMLHKAESSTTGIRINKNCTLSDGTRGECVLYFLCNSHSKIITDGAGILDDRASYLSSIKSKRSVRLSDGQCSSYLETCCSLPEEKSTEDTPQPSAQSAVDLAPATDVQKGEGCGWRNPITSVDLNTTRNDDGNAQFGEFPWLCAVTKLERIVELESDSPLIHVYIGGASLIHPSVALTSASVVNKGDDLKKFSVRAGDWDISDTKEMYPHQHRQLESIAVHDNFNSANLHYGIAILFLAQPVDLAPNVAPVCLPPPRQSTPDSTLCFATGWGKDKFGKGGRYQVLPKKVEVPVVAHDRCQKQLRRSILGHYYQLHPTFMCAGGEQGKDMCSGDGGSPLSCPVKGQADRFFQSGIVSWGIGCHKEGLPGVYVDVANLRDWIDVQVTGKGYDPKVYTI